jgi:hypothetical protein
MNVDNRNQFSEEATDILEIAKFVKIYNKFLTYYGITKLFGFLLGPESKR